MVTEFQKNMLKVSRLIVCLGALLLCGCVETPEYAVVNLKASPPEGGTVSSNPPGPEYNIGMNVTFKAVAKPGYVFLGWEGYVSDTLNTVTKTITGDKYNEKTMATAVFAKAYTLRVNATPANGGTVTISPPPARDSTYEDGTKVKVQAKPESGYKFYRWSGASSDSTSKIEITMGRNTPPLTANFVQASKLTVNATPEEGGTVAITPTPDPDSTYYVKQPVNVEAKPNRAMGYIFNGWSGDTTSTFSAIQLSMSRGRNVTANFVKANKLRVIVSPTGGGTVTIAPPPPKDSIYNAGTFVTAQAMAQSGYRFDGWSGDTTSSNAAIRLPMNIGWTLIANFVKGYTLTVTEKTVDGEILVKKEEKHDAGTQVTVTASDRANYRFYGWSGALSSTDSIITITMDRDTLLNANFVKVFKLTVNATPEEGGTVIITPPPNSDSTYDVRQPVNIEATPKSGYKFDGWSGDTTSTLSAIRLSMNRRWNVTAKFVKVNKLNVAVSTTGGGTVTLLPRPPLDSIYDAGTQVIATAVPKSGYRFDRWSGDTTSTDPEIRLSMNRGRTLIANFVRVYKLTVIGMTANGKDTLWGPRDSLYNKGTQVPVTAPEINGYRFERWAGAYTGYVSEGAVTVDTNKLAIAIYVRLYTLTINKNIDGGMTAPSGTSSYAEGTEVHVIAKSNAGYKFTTWSGASTETTLTTVVTMNGPNTNKILTANFIRQTAKIRR